MVDQNLLGITKLNGVQRNVSNAAPPAYSMQPTDDIIVCKDSPVNICDLINRCRPVGQVPCDPMHPGPTDPCPEGPEDWVLAICYDEKSSRGVAAITSSTF